MASALQHGQLGLVLLEMEMFRAGGVERSRLVIEGTSLGVLASEGENGGGKADRDQLKWKHLSRGSPEKAGPSLRMF